MKEEVNKRKRKLFYFFFKTSFSSTSSEDIELKQIEWTERVIPMTLLKK